MARRSLERLAEVSAGPAVLAAARRFPGLWLVGGAVRGLELGAPVGGLDVGVGGAVRDLELGAPVRDLDVAVEGEAPPVAEALGDLIAEHGRFGTAEVRAP